MNLSEKFENLIKDKYLFHLHTDYTDGVATVEEYCRYALENGYKHIIFTEHVRKKLLFNFNNFLIDINNARQKFKNLDIWLGVEAKVLPNGNLDLPEEFLENIKVIGIACHSFNASEDEYFRSLKKIFDKKTLQNKVKVWLHPSTFFIKNGVKDKNNKFRDLLNLAIKNNVFIEFNKRYDVDFLSLFKKVCREKLVIGLNGHSVEEL